MNLIIVSILFLFIACSQGQFCYISCALLIIWFTLLVFKIRLIVNGPTTDYVNSFCNYLRNRRCYVRFLNVALRCSVSCSSHFRSGAFVVEIHVPILGVPVFFLLLMENKNVRRVTSIDDCLLLQPDVNSVHNCCTSNHMKFDTGKAKPYAQKK